MKRRLQQLTLLLNILKSQEGLSAGDKTELLGTCIRTLHSCGVGKQDIHDLTEQIYAHDPIKAIIVHNP